MAIQGPNNPGTMADDSTVGISSWQDINNAIIEDGTPSSTSGKNEQTHYLKATNFGFSIPSGATINGITQIYFCFACN